MAATTAGATKGWQAAALRRGLHGLAWAVALLSVGDGLYRVSTTRGVAPPSASRPSPVVVTALPPTQTLPGIWRWRLQVRHAAGTTPCLLLHTWQSRSGSRFDDHLPIPLDVVPSSGDETFDVTMTPGPSRDGREYLGDPAAQLYLCDTLAVRIAASTSGAKAQTIFVPNPFRAATQNGNAAESLPTIIVKDGTRTAIWEKYSNDQNKQCVDLALTARSGWGVTGGATLEFDAFGS